MKVGDVVQINVRWNRYCYENGAVQQLAYITELGSSYCKFLYLNNDKTAEIARSTMDRVFNKIEVCDEA